MNTDKTSVAARRSLSLGAVIKEQRVVRTGVPDIEYGLGNGNENGNSSGDEEAENSKKRVVMMYDEDGNATPMPMAQFYYDSVQAHSAADKDEEDKAGKGASSTNISALDTVRSNVPAPFTGKSASDYSSTSTSKEDDVDIHNTDGRNFVADDSEYDELENEEDGDDDDPFKNQFMRIEIAATGLKDVKRVKQDLDHDKPNKKTGIRAGLQRAVSTAKIAEGTRARTTASANVTRAPSTSSTSKSSNQVTPRQLSNTGSGLSKAGSGLSRMLSFTRGKSDRHSQPTSEVEPPAETVHELRNTGASSCLQRARESTAKPVRRQGLAAVGRMISINKQKGRTSSPQLASNTLEDLPAPVPDRASLSESDDRVRHSGALSPGVSKPAGRASIAQVGRLLSFSKKKPATSTASKQTDENSETDGSARAADRIRRETEATKQNATRMGLAKLGRVLSFNRSKPAYETKDDGSVGPVSPLSSSTVSTGVDSTSRDATSSDRNRDRLSSSSLKKEPSRMKVASRMLSFSRKPAQSSRQGRTLMLSSDDKREKGEKRSQSVPPGASPDSVSGQKLDGRGDKFVFWEIHSEKVNRSGLLSERHIRVPIIAMAEYSGPVSRTKWYIDGFTLPHNAVRRECVDLYDILIAMAQCHGNTDICKDDMDDFEDWWKVASEFFNCYFDMERRVLFPWVESAGSHDWEVQIALRKMRSMKDKLQEQLQQVDRLWNEKTFKEVGGMFALIYKAVDEFVPRLMNYFADQEVLLPAIVKGYYRLDDRLKMDKDMVAVFMGDNVRKDKDSARHNLILLIRWIGNPRQLRAWIGKYLSSNARSMYPRWYALYEEDHLRIMKQVKTRARACASVS